MAEQNKFLLVDLSVLPEVFTKVVEAKRYMAQGKAKSYSDAAKMAGISRSAFYKYKDKVYPYESNSLTRVLTLTVTLVDEPGILSSLITGLYQIGANIITINQNIPVDGVGAGIGIAAHRPGNGAMKMWSAMCASCRRCVGAHCQRIGKGSFYH